jgi:hypothetical protein
VVQSENKTLQPGAAVLSADEVARVMQDWLAQSKDKKVIPVGTMITIQNWQQYKQFVPVGMIGLFEGRYFWKMPNDVEMYVEPRSFIRFRGHM